jgi:hypothetical protein
LTALSALGIGKKILVGIVILENECAVGTVWPSPSQAYSGGNVQAIFALKLLLFGALLMLHLERCGIGQHGHCSAHIFSDAIGALERKQAAHPVRRVTIN